MNTHESYVSLETAKMLKKAGFDWVCRAKYTIHSTLKSLAMLCKPFQNFNEREHNFSAPTLDVAQRWLREEKSINIEVKILSITSGQLMWYAKIYYLQKHNGIYDQVEFIQHTEISYDSYEQALEAGIKRALEIILII